MRVAEQRAVAGGGVHRQQAAAVQHCAVWQPDHSTCCIAAACKPALHPAPPFLCRLALAAAACSGWLSPPLFLCATTLARCLLRSRMEHARVNDHAGGLARSWCGHASLMHCHRGDQRPFFNSVWLNLVAPMRVRGFNVLHCVWPAVCMQQPHPACARGMVLLPLTLMLTNVLCAFHVGCRPRGGGRWLTLRTGEHKTTCRCTGLHACGGCSIRGQPLLCCCFALASTAPSCVWVLSAAGSSS